MPGGKIDILVEPDMRAFPSKLASGLRSSSGIASSIGRGLGLAVAAGTAVAAGGLASVIKLGNEYQGNLNELQAVSGATAIQMAKVGQTAKALGADMTLPATSAADAANAMVELAKGGLSVDEAMQAAKGTLQLAAAAQVDGATAAELQSAALNSFGLAADQAGRVADVLANTANASASSMIDVGNSLKYVAPVSAALKVSIEDTAAAIGLLANQGVKGEQAGTSLRGILASLASPSAAAADGLKTLGVQAFDAQGKFVGLRVFTDQLAQAKGRLTDAEFAAAASTAFGNEGFTAANALAAEGAASFDEMATSVSRAGGAADVAAAQTKGLGGAWEGFKSQLETAGIEVYEVIAPGLERATRSAAEFVAGFTPKIVTGLETAVAAGELFGPQLAEALVSRGDALLDVVSDIIDPVVAGLVDSLNGAVNVGTTVFGGFADVVREGADAVVPLAEGVGNLLEGLNQATGPVGALVAGLELVYDITAGIVRVIAPAVAVIGDLASAFGDLPGPIQTAAVAVLALRAGPAVLGGLRTALRGTATDAGEAGRQAGLLGRAWSTVTAPVQLAASGIGSAVGVVRQFNDEARVQRAVATEAGDSVGRLGTYAAAFNTSTIPAIAAARGFAEQTSAIRDGAAAAGQPISTMGAAVGTLVERSPALSAMKASFDRASSGAERFGRTAGIAAAAGSGLRSAAGGLISAFGGPWGVALGIASGGLALLAGANADAAAEEQAHREQVDSLAGALRESNGVINDHIRALALKRLEDKGAAQLARDLDIPVRTLTDAYLGNKNALTQVQAALQVYLDQVAGQGQLEGQVAGSNPMADKAHELKNQLGELIPEISAANDKNKEFEEATATGAAAMLTAAERSQGLGAAMDVLADNTSTADDKARALKDALDALSGGNITLEQAQSRVNEQLAQISDKFGENLDKANGWGAALLNANGSVNTTTENGRFLLDTLDDLGASTADLAQKTFDAAIAQGDDMPTALEKARQASQGVRDSFAAQADQLGLTTEQVQALADRYGIVPEDIVTLIQTPGMSQAQIDMEILRQKVGNVPPNKSVTVTGLTDSAVKKLEDIGYRVEHLKDGSFKVTANTKTADDILAGLARKWNGYTIYLNTQIRGRNNQIAQMGGGLNGAIGGIVETYAQGGIRKLTPLNGKIAHRVPANTWRVIGDRQTGIEYFLPDDEKPRTMAIGAEWARRRGLVLVRKYADGGIATPATTATAAAPGAGVTVNMPVQVQDNRSAYEFARVASSDIAWAARFSG
ncbi:MAG: phage tail tape measure protein [Actinophytocola sp.]|uniref:phage tail tape measure protein n=1 Tax=Actinophytocola sp. TaxID=1872138 RepID=UPI003C7706DF